MATVKVVRQCSFDSHPPLPPKNKYSCLDEDPSNSLSNQISTSSWTLTLKRQAFLQPPRALSPAILRPKRTRSWPSFRSVPVPAGHEHWSTSIHSFWNISKSLALKIKLNHFSPPNEQGLPSPFSLLSVWTFRDSWELKIILVGPKEARGDI